MNNLHGRRIGKKNYYKLFCTLALLPDNIFGIEEDEKKCTYIISILHYDMGFIKGCPVKVT